MKKLDNSWFAFSSKALWQKVVPAALLCASAAVCAQSYPTQPVTVIVPFSAGGAVDIAGRLIAEPLTKLLGQSFVVDNRPGASGNIGYSVVAHAPKDGYTVLVGYSSTHACNPALYPNLDWNPNKDFAPVGMMATSTLVIAISPTIPVNTLTEFIAYLKKHPGEVNFGSPGNGSLAHLAGEILQQKTGTKMVHVPYKGSGSAITDLLSGRIHLLFAGPPSVMQYVRAGKLKALAITSMSRQATLPDIPTANESGMPGFELEGWLGLFVPAGTPAQTIAKLTNALKRSTEQPVMQQRISDAGLETRYLGPDALAAKVRTELENCTAMIRKARITLE